jgi:hypothetical protein
VDTAGQSSHYSKNTSIYADDIFEDRFVISEDRAVCNDQDIVFKRSRPKLADNAYPSIFANIPEYLSSAVRQSAETWLIEVLNWSFDMKSLSLIGLNLMKLTHFSCL